MPCRGNELITFQRKSRRSRQYCLSVASRIQAWSGAASSPGQDLSGNRFDNLIDTMEKEARATEPGESAPQVYTIDIRALNAAYRERQTGPQLPLERAKAYLLACEVKHSVSMSSTVRSGPATRAPTPASLALVGWDQLVKSAEPLGQQPFPTAGACLPPVPNGVTAAGSAHCGVAAAASNARYGSPRGVLSAPSAPLATVGEHRSGTSAPYAAGSMPRSSVSPPHEAFGRLAMSSPTAHGPSTPVHATPSSEQAQVASPYGRPAPVPRSATSANPYSRTLAAPARAGYSVPLASVSFSPYAPPAVAPQIRQVVAPAANGPVGSNCACHGRARCRAWSWMEGSFARLACYSQPDCAHGLSSATWSCNGAECGSSSLLLPRLSNWQLGRGSKSSLMTNTADVYRSRHETAVRPSCPRDDGWAESGGRPRRLPYPNLRGRRPQSGSRSQASDLYYPLSHAHTATVPLSRTDRGRQEGLRPTEGRPPTERDRIVGSCEVTAPSDLDAVPGLSHKQTAHREARAPTHTMGVKLAQSQIAVQR
jgi:hypothetical protein